MSELALVENVCIQQKKSFVFCSSWTVYVRRFPAVLPTMLTFVVDTNKLGDKEDVAADDMGVWKNNWVDTGYVQVSMVKDEITQAKKCSTPTSNSPLVYTVKRVYRTHETNFSLRKLTASLYGEYCTLVGKPHIDDLYTILGIFILLECGICYQKFGCELLLCNMTVFVLWQL